tara:strand:- start:537 stop:779 length:243 start_codon:yes stop_codon:yes gene_type:complete
MSTQPEEIEDIEIEEGEIISEDDISEMEDDDDDSMDIAELMTSLLATDEGDTVCSALVNIANQLQTQNKILIKMLSQIKN